MYFKNRSSDKEDHILIEMAWNFFKVEKQRIKKKILSATEVIIGYDDDGKVIGFLCYRINKGVMIVDIMILDPNYIGNGLASSFYPEFIKQAKEKGIKKLRGIVEKTNKKAYLILKHWGFKVKRNFFTAVLMEKKLED